MIALASTAFAQVDEVASEQAAVLDTILSKTFFGIVAALLLAMLVSAVGVYLFERRHNAAEFNKSWPRGVAAGMWWAAVTLTTVGYGDKVPRSTGGRVIGFLWMFVGLFIVASFTAAVTSALTVTRLRSQINGPARSESRHGRGLHFGGLPAFQPHPLHQVR